MTDYAIQTIGLRDLRRELKALGPQWPREMRVAEKAAAEIVAAQARTNLTRVRSLVPRAKYPRADRQHWADMVRTVKSLADTTSARVALGSNRVAWALGENFGSLKYHQFPPVEAPDHGLYKAIESERPKVVDFFGDSITRLTSRAFPDAA